MRLSATYSIVILLAASILCINTACESIINEELPSYEQTSIVGIADKAPEFTIMSLDDEELSMPNGNTTLLILFSHTCPDCKAMMSELQRQIDNSAKSLNIIAISRGGSEDEIRAFRDELSLTFPIAVDTTKEIYYTYATMYVPRCYIINSKGDIQFMTYEYEQGDIDNLIAAYYENGGL